MANNNLGQVVKQQIMVHLKALQTANVIASYYALDTNADPLSVEPPNGYPFAIVAMPRVLSDFEDQVMNMRTYRFDVLFVVDPQGLTDQETGLEQKMDAVMNEFDKLTSLTLSGNATAAVLPITIESSPISTATKTYLAFVATIQARTLYQTS